ncbi:MAG TPA: hypothetical protein VNF07_09820 [Acidimicrobiales bacterium]|nr:hypothetical protein [Acidimicrobiales bacterium]
MIGLIDGVARRLLRRGLRQGLLEGNAAWLMVAAAAGLARLLLRPESPKVIREELRVGESLTVTHVAPPRRRRGKDTAEAEQA